MKASGSALSTLFKQASRADLVALVNQNCPACFVVNALYKSGEKSLSWKLAPVHTEWSVKLKWKPRVRILAPRDHAKSEVCTVGYSLWRAKYRPGVEIYILSATDELADALGARVKAYAEAVPTLAMIAKGGSWSNGEMKFKNGSTIICKSYWAASRGPHPDIIILDDVIGDDEANSAEQNKKAIDRFYSVIVGMAKPDTQIVVVGTVQREDDLYSELAAPAWDASTYCALVNAETHEVLFPQKWDYAALMARKAEITGKRGERFWLKEYQNDPTALQGQVFQYGWLRWYRADQRPTNLPIYQGWDLSVGKGPDSDYTAGASIAVDEDGTIYVLDMLRQRLSFPDRLKAVSNKAAAYVPTEIAMENNSFADDTVQEVIRTTNLPVKGVKTISNKFARLQSLAVLFENGKIKLPISGVNTDGKPLMEMWVDDLIHELINFPGAYDDQLDALDIAIQISRQPRARVSVISLGGGPVPPPSPLDVEGRRKADREAFAQHLKDQIHDHIFGGDR